MKHIFNRRLGGSPVCGLVRLGLSSVVKPTCNGEYPSMLFDCIINK